MSAKHEKDIQELDSPDLDAQKDEKHHGIAEAEIDGISGLRTVEVGLAPEQVIVELDQKEQTRILRKVDYRLVPLLALLYL
jgi:hypothetical protein